MEEESADFLTYFDRQVGRDGEIDDAIATISRARNELADWERHLRHYKRGLGTTTTSVRSSSFSAAAEKKRLPLAFVEKAAALARAPGTSLPAPVVSEPKRDATAGNKENTIDDDGIPSYRMNSSVPSKRASSAARLQRLAEPSKRGGVCIFVSRIRVRRSDGAMEKPKLKSSLLIALPPRTNSLADVATHVALATESATRRLLPPIEDFFNEAGTRIVQFSDIVDSTCISFRCTGDCAPSQTKLTKQRRRGQRKTNARLAEPVTPAFDAHFRRFRHHEGQSLVVRIHPGLTSIDELLDKVESAVLTVLPGPIRSFYLQTSLKPITTMKDVHDARAHMKDVEPTIYFTCFGDAEPKTHHNRKADTMAKKKQTTKAKKKAWHATQSVAAGE